MMYKSPLTIVPLILLSSKIIVFITFACDPEAPGLQYADYNEECIVGGYEKFTLQYKLKNAINAKNAVKKFQCKLCNPSQYLDCYTSLSQDDPLFETGSCQCISTHSKGYILVYDESVKECRGYKGSTCNRGMPCHEKFQCDFGTCACAGAYYYSNNGTSNANNETSSGNNQTSSSDCEKGLSVSPLNFPEYKISSAVIHVPPKEISLIVVLLTYFKTLFRHLNLA